MTNEMETCPESRRDGLCFGGAGADIEKKLSAHDRRLHREMARREGSLVIIKQLTTGSGFLYVSDINPNSYFFWFATAA